MGKVNLRNVARELDLSPMTLYRALNTPSMVNSKTRKRILSVLNKRGYFSRPRKISDNILLDPGNSYMRSRFSIPLLQRLTNRNLTCLILPEGKSDREMMRFFENASTLICCSFPDAERIQKIKDVNPDIFVINLLGGNVGDVSINPDDWGGGALAAEYLHQKGCRHIAVCTCLKEPNHINRTRGFIGTMTLLDPKARIDIVTLNPMGRIIELEEYFSNMENIPSAVYFTNGGVLDYFLLFVSQVRPEFLKTVNILSFDTPGKDSPSLYYAIDRLCFSDEAVLYWAEYYVTTTPLMKDFQKKHAVVDISIVNVTNETGCCGICS